MPSEYGFQDAEFYFTYAFMLSLPGGLNRFAEKAAKAFPKSLVSVPPTITDGWGPFGGDIEPLLALRSQQLYIVLGPIKCELCLRIYDEKERVYLDRVMRGLTLRWRLRVFRSGIGALTLKLTGKRDWTLSPNEVIAISRAGSVASPKAENASLVFPRKPWLSKALETKPRANTFVALFRATVERLAARTGAACVESKEQLVSARRNFSPYITMRLELGRGVTNLDQALDDSVFRNELARVVLRVRQEWRQVSPSYVAKHLDDLSSYIPHSRYWLMLHLRSCTYIHCVDSERKDKYPVQYCKSLLDTIELLRMQWHSYAVYNKFLDNLIYGIVGSAKRSRPQADVQLVRKISRVRQELALALESPVSYKRAAGSLNEVFVRGVEVFGIDRIESLVLEKLRMVDQLYTDRLEMLRGEDFAKIHKRLLGARGREK